MAIFDPYCICEPNRLYKSLDQCVVAGSCSKISLQHFNSVVKVDLHSLSSYFSIYNIINLCAVGNIFSSRQDLNN